jgi:hypothetical protein
VLLPRGMETFRSERRRRAGFGVVGAGDGRGELAAGNFSIFT